MIDLQIKALHSVQHWIDETGNQLDALHSDYNGYLNHYIRHVFWGGCNGIKYAVSYIYCFDMRYYSFIEFEDEYVLKGFSYENETIELTNKSFYVVVSSQFLTECSLSLHEYISLILLNNANPRFKNRIQIVPNLETAIWLEYINSDNEVCSTIDCC